MTGGASLFEIPLSLNQTPVSEVGGGDVVTTGAFFSKPQKQEDFQGAHNLIGGSVQANGLSVAIAAGAALLVIALMRKL